LPWFQLFSRISPKLPLQWFFRFSPVAPSEAPPSTTHNFAKSAALTPNTPPTATIGLEGEYHRPRHHRHRWESGWSLSLLRPQINLGFQRWYQNEYECRQVDGGEGSSQFQSPATFGIITSLCWSSLPQ
jgi:hypothetical protein